MCVIVYSPWKKTVPKEVLERCFDANDDGAGFSYAAGGKMIVEKGFFKFKDFWKAFEPIQREETVIHFRIKTHGTIDEDNCHPFLYKSKKNPRYEWAIAHNGTLPWASTPKRSDTNCFVSEFLGPILDEFPDFFEDDARVDMLKMFINQGAKTNKLAIQRYDTQENFIETYLINRVAFNEAHDAFFSNYSHTPKVAVQYGYGAHYGGDWHGSEGYQQPLPGYYSTKKPDKFLTKPENVEFLKTMGWELDSKTGLWIQPDKDKQLALTEGAKKEADKSKDSEAAVNKMIEEGSANGKVVHDDEAAFKKDALNLDIKHLNKSMAGKLRFIAHKYSSYHPGPATAQAMTSNEKVLWLRQCATEAMEEWFQDSDKVLDIKIINEYNDTFANGKPSLLFGGLFDFESAYRAAKATGALN